MTAAKTSVVLYLSKATYINDIQFVNTILVTVQGSRFKTSSIQIARKKS